jgi:hypothetical protein
VQGGHDSFHACGSRDAHVFLARALAIEAELGVPVHHETHRGRVLFAPWAAAEAVAAFGPRLKLLGDLSHFCAVCEASCGEPELEDAVASIVPSIRHLHARVGFAEGPQVPDPRMPEHAGQLSGHARWWSAVFDAAAARGDAEITVTPEFLPPPYCWTTAPSAGEPAVPVADVKAVNAFMAEYVRGVFAEAAASRLAK